MSLEVLAILIEDLKSTSKLLRPANGAMVKCKEQF